jgi:hypothetical protein
VPTEREHAKSRYLTATQNPEEVPTVSHAHAKYHQISGTAPEDINNGSDVFLLDTECNKYLMH